MIKSSRQSSWDAWAYRQSMTVAVAGIAFSVSLVLAAVLAVVFSG